MLIDTHIYFIAININEIMPLRQTCVRILSIRKNTESGAAENQNEKKPSKH